MTGVGLDPLPSLNDNEPILGEIISYLRSNSESQAIQTVTLPIWGGETESRMLKVTDNDHNSNIILAMMDDEVNLTDGLRKTNYARTDLKKMIQKSYLHPNVLQQAEL